MKVPYLKALLSSALLGLLPAASHADDLLSVFQQASANDPVIRIARAQYNATHTALKEGLAQLLPSVTLNGSTARNTQAPTEAHSFADGFNTHSYSLSLNQNLLNFEAWYNFQSVRESDKQALSALAIAEQQLILRVASAYFNVLRSQNNLAVFTAQEAAAREVMNQTEQRYELGFAEISDVYDSRTSYSQARVSRLDEQNLLQERIEALEIISGGNHGLLEGLSENFPVVSANPRNLEEWLALTQANNLDIQAAEFVLAGTEHQARAAKSAMLPTLTLTANYNDTAERDNPFAFISQASNSTAISLNVSMPLYRGGANKARLQRAYYSIDANKERLEQVERESLAQTRNSYRSIETALQTVAAREETISFAESALEATEVGMEVGTRNIVDLLQAQRAVFQAQRDYANARLDYVITTLNLKQAAGTLSPQDVIDLNDWLE